MQDRRAETPGVVTTSFFQRLSCKAILEVSVSSRFGSTAILVWKGDHRTLVVHDVSSHASDEDQLLQEAQEGMVIPYRALSL